MAAHIRERANFCDTGRKMTLIAKLLAWLKHAGNRDENLRNLAHLRESTVSGRRVSRVAWNFGDDPCELYAAVPTVSGRWAASGWVCRCSAVTS